MKRSYNSLNKIIELCKTLGFLIESRVKKDGLPVYHDYGPLGVLTKRNIQNEWWHEIVTSRDNIYAVELSTFFQPQEMNEKFNNFRSDVHGDELERKIKGLPSSLKNNLDDSSSVCAVNNEVDDFIFICRYLLRDECSVTNLEYFSNINMNARQVPFGVAQCRKSSKSSLPNQFPFRFQEEQQLFLQFLCHESKSYQWLNYWRRHRLKWWKKFANTPSNFSLGAQMSSDNFRAKTEILYEFPWGKESVESILHNTNLIQMAPRGMNNDCPSNVKDLSHLHLIQLTTSLDKGFLAILLDAYQEKQQSLQEGQTGLHIVLALHPNFAPIKVAIILCDTERSELHEVAQKLASELRSAGIVTRYEESSDEDQRFVSHDAAGTPYCVTIRESILMDGFVALRNRDTGVQEFLHISELLRTLQTRVGLLYRCL